MRACLQAYTREQWLAHLNSLGEETFLGTSRRYFLRSEKAAGLLSSWVDRLHAQGVEFFFGEELTDFCSSDAGITLTFRSGRQESAATALLALGGASWEETPPSWPSAFAAHGIPFMPFEPANAGYSFRAPEGFFATAEGLPVKGFTLRTARGEKTGECMITRYGLEGTPVYSVGCPGPAVVDLKPDLTEEKLALRLGNGRSLKGAKLSPGAERLFLALSPGVLGDPGRVAARLKSLPIELLAPRPLSDSISSRGGVSWDALSPELELRKARGVYCAGEMVDWDAPTGGFLLQGSVSMAAVAAGAIASRLSSDPSGR